MEEEMNMRLLPKGLIVLGLGGYSGENSHLAEGVVEQLIPFLERNNMAIAVIDGKLDFVKIGEITEEP